MIIITLIAQDDSLTGFKYIQFKSLCRVGYCMYGVGTYWILRGAWQVSGQNHRLIVHHEYVYLCDFIFFL